MIIVLTLVIIILMNYYVLLRLTLLQVQYKTLTHLLIYFISNIILWNTNYTASQKIT